MQFYHLAAQSTGQNEFIYYLPNQDKNLFFTESSDPEYAFTSWVAPLRQLHHCPAGTWAFTDSTCFPQPAQVVFWHFLQVTGRHIAVPFSLSPGYLAYLQ